MKTFLIQWTEEVTTNCSVIIKAEDQAEALDLFLDGDFDDIHREAADRIRIDEPTFEILEEDT